MRKFLSFNSTEYQKNANITVNKGETLTLLMHNLLDILGDYQPCIQCSIIYLLVFLKKFLNLRHILFQTCANFQS